MDDSCELAALPDQSSAGDALFGQEALLRENSAGDSSFVQAALLNQNCAEDSSFGRAALLSQNCAEDAASEKSAMPDENCDGNASCEKAALPNQNSAEDASCEQAALPNQNSAGDASSGQAALPNQNCAGNDSFAFWRHIPPPSLWFMPGVQLHPYYGGLTWPPYDPYQQYWNGTYYGWNAAYYGYPVQYAPQATTDFRYHHAGMVEKPSNQELTSLVGGSHNATPMDISPSVSPVNAGTGYTSTKAEAEATTLKVNNYYQGTDESLKPHKAHKVDPRLASLLKRCEPCVRKILSQARGEGSAKLAEHCSCAVELASDKASPKNSNDSGTTKTEVERMHQRPTAITELTPMPPCPPEVGSFQKTSEYGQSGLAQYTKRSAVTIANLVQVADRVMSPSSTFFKKRRSRTLVRIDCLAAGDSLSSEQDCGQERRPVLGIADLTKGAHAENPSFVSRQQKFVEYTVDGAGKGASDAWGRGRPDRDDAEGCRLSGAYALRPEIEILTTPSVHFEVGLLLGSRIDFLDEPLKLASELEKLDEGWLWCFE